MITIYGRASSWNVRKVLFFLEDVGLPYERLDIGRGFSPTNTPEFLALNPKAWFPFSPMRRRDLGNPRNPALSRRENGPESYFPANFARRAIVDQWLDWKIARCLGSTAAVFPVFLEDG